MLPFHVLTSLEVSLRAVLSILTHKELEVFWNKCNIPKEVLERYYRPWPPAPPGYYYPKPSKKKIIEGIIGELDKRGLLGSLMVVLDETIAYGRGLGGAEIKEAVIHLESLRRRIQGREVGVAERKKRADERKGTESHEQGSKTLQELHQEFLELLREKDHQRRGYRFESLLNDLFELNGLNPRKAFKIVGEQIDGTFELDHHTFLLEARWRVEAASASDTYVLRGKVEGRLEGKTLGLFVSLNGFTPATPEALVQGKRPNLLLTDGEVLTGVLEGRWRFDEAIRAMVREASQTGNPYLKARDIAL